MERSCPVLSENREGLQSLVSCGGGQAEMQGMRVADLPVQLHVEVGCATQQVELSCSAKLSKMQCTKHGKKIIKLHQKSIVFVLKYMTDGLRILHPLLLSRQFFLLRPDNTNVGIVLNNTLGEKMKYVIYFSLCSQ